MTGRIYITRSNSGHYTVTQRDAGNTVVRKEGKLSSLRRAQLIAAEWRAAA